MADVTITEEQMSKIRNVLGGLRYSGGMGVHPRQVVDGDSLHEYLKTFAQILLRVSDKNEAQERELRQLKADLQAAGRVLTLMQPPVPEQAPQSV